MGASRQHLEGQGLERIAGEDGGGLVKGPMHRGLPATQVVIVHGREVIVNQRVGMDQLQRHGRGVQVVIRGAQGAAGRIDQHRPQPLAAHQQGVAHGRLQTRGGGGTLLEERREAGIDPGTVRRQS